MRVLEAAAETGEPFSCSHRIIDRSKRVSSVLSVGHGIKGPDGRVARVEGCFVDLTQVRPDETEAEVQTAVAWVAEHRKAIRQRRTSMTFA